MRARRPSPPGPEAGPVPAGRPRAPALVSANPAVSAAPIRLRAGPTAMLAALLGLALTPALAAPDAPLPPTKPQARAVAPPAPVRPPAARATPLPPERPAEVEAAREAEAQENAQDNAQEDAPEAARPAPEPAPVRLATGTPVPTPAGRRPPGRAMPLPPERPAEIEAAREAEAQDSAQDNAQDAARPAPEPASPFRLASRTTAPEPAFAPFVPAAPAAPPPSVAPDAPAGEAGALPPVCAALVEDGAIRAELDPSIPRKGSCGLAEPVRLTAVRLADGTMVPLKPAAVSNCAVAAAAAGWVREELAPAVAALGAPLAAVRIAASYQCRPRNRIPGARMSEHGLGNALDVGGFELADGRVALVEKGGLPPRLRAAMKESACRRFTTVLGPGSDGYHEDHIHVDLAQRRLDIRLCRWNLDAGTAVAARKGKPAAPKPEAGGTAPAEAPAARPDGASAPEAQATAGPGSAKP